MLGIIRQMHAHLALTVREAAQSLRVSREKIRALIRSGEIAAFSVGPKRGTRISVRSLERFMAERSINDFAAK